MICYKELKEKVQNICSKSPKYMLREFLKKLILKKVGRQQQKHENLPSMQRVQGETMWSELNFKNFKIFMIP